MRPHSTRNTATWRPATAQASRQTLRSPEEPAFDLGGGGGGDELAADDEVERDRRAHHHGGDGGAAARLPPSAAAERVDPCEEAGLGPRQRREPEPHRPEPGTIPRDGPGAGGHAERRQRHLHAGERPPHEATERDGRARPAPHADGGAISSAAARRRVTSAGGGPAGQAERLRGRETGRPSAREAGQRHAPEGRGRGGHRLAALIPKPPPVARFRASRRWIQPSSSGSPGAPAIRRSARRNKATASAPAARSAPPTGRGGEPRPRAHAGPTVERGRRP